MMVDAGREKGVIDEEETEIIQNVFEFDDITAGELATHRTDIALRWTDETMEQWATIMNRAPLALSGLRRKRGQCCGRAKREGLLPLRR